MSMPVVRDARSVAAMVEGAPRSWHDAGNAPGRTLAVFPGLRRGKPMTTRQLNRLFHEAADAAGIRKGVTLHAPAPQLRDPPA